MWSKLLAGIFIFKPIFAPFFGYFLVESKRELFDFYNLDTVI